MRQALLAAMFCLNRDLRMAGCNPWDISDLKTLDARPDGFDGVRRFTIRLDKRGRDPGSCPDGDAEDPDERIEYRWLAGTTVLRRNGQPLLLEVQDNPWGKPFFYFEESGGYGLARVLVTVHERGETRSFLTSVCIRNPL